MKSNNNIYYIYLIINIFNGSIYVGQSKNPQKRFEGHCKNKKSILGRNIQKYGRKNFQLITVARYSTPEETNEAEIFLIKELNTLVCNGNGYNVAEGGYNNPFVGMTDEQKSEFSKKCSNSIKGKKRSDETKRKMSEKQKGITCYRYPDGTTKQLSIYHEDVLSGLAVGNNKDQKRSDEIKKKISESVKGKNIGKKRSDEIKKKMSENQKGKIPGNKFNLYSLPQETHLAIVEMRNNNVSLKKISSFLLETFKLKCSPPTIKKYF